MYTRIDLLKDIYEYEKEMRKYEEENRKHMQARQEVKYDPEQEARGNRTIHPEYLREPDSMDIEPLG